MSFAIITNVHRSNEENQLTKCRFSLGPKTIRKIVFIPEDAGEIFKTDSQLEQDEQLLGSDITVADVTVANTTVADVTVADTVNKYNSIVEFELLTYIREQSNNIYPAIGFTMEGLTDGELYLTKIDYNKFLLNRLVISDTWFRNTLSSYVIGKYYTMPMVEDYTVSSPKITELKSLLESTLNEKSNILAQSCAFQSQVANLNVENKFLQTIIDKFHSEIEKLNNRYEETQVNTIARFNDLENKLTFAQPQYDYTPREKRVDPRKTVNNEVVGKFENSLVLLMNFDKSRLRSITNTINRF